MEKQFNERFRRQQQLASGLGGLVVEMQQILLAAGGNQGVRAVDGSGGDIVGQQPVGRHDPDLGGGDGPPAGRRQEDLAQMGLAAAGRAVDDQGRRRPVGPAVEPGDRLGIAGRDQEVVAAESGTGLESEAELGRRRQEALSPLR